MRLWFPERRRSPDPCTERSVHLPAYRSTGRQGRTHGAVIPRKSLKYVKVGCKTREFEYNRKENIIVVSQEFRTIAEM